MIGHFANACLRPLGLKLVQDRIHRKPWDEHFIKWIAKAKKLGRDPNDVADETWGDVTHLIARYYLPHVRQDATILELGPGSGRITRHLIDLCKQLIVVDYSEFVVAWIDEYLSARGKRNFIALKVDNCRLDPVADASIDLVVADGVFHHIDIEDFHRYLSAFKRVLRPGGRVAVNFVNIMASEGYSKFRVHADATNERDVFRWHHPDTVKLLSENLGFVDIALQEERVLAGDFVCYLTCKAP